MKAVAYLWLLLLSAAPTFAQTGTLKGVVTDESGGVVICRSVITRSKPRLPSLRFRSLLQSRKARISFLMGLVETKYGLLDPNPIPGEVLLPRNYGRGPGLVLANLRITKTFAFGPAGETAAPATR
jgi:hypothetical protein